MIADFNSVAFPFLRIIGLSALWAPTLVSNTGTHLSNFSHIGGFVCGAALGLGMIQHIVPKKLKATVPMLAGSVLILMLIVVPSFVHRLAISGITCDPPLEDVIFKSIPH